MGAFWRVEREDMMSLRVSKVIFQKRTVSLSGSWRDGGDLGVVSVLVYQTMLDKMYGIAVPTKKADNPGTYEP